MDIIQVKRNKYDYFLFLISVSLAFGGIGGAFQIPRILGLLFFPFFIMRVNTLGKEIRNHLAIILCFIVYCAVSLLWSPNQTEGFVDLLYFHVHFLLFLEIIVFSMCANNPHESISKGWAMAVLLTIIFALWEFQSGWHMPYNRNNQENMVNVNGIILQKDFAAVTFANYNCFVTFLCFAIPFLFYLIANKQREKLLFYWMSIVLIGLSFYCILRNGSRGGLLSIVLMAGIYFWMKPKNTKWFITLIVFFLIIYYVFYKYGDNFSYLMARVSDGNLTEGGDRLVVWSYALKQFFSTYGFGVGIGGMFEAMNGVASNIKITHNIFMEILLLHGLFFFTVFVVFLVKMLNRARRIKDYATRVTLYLALIPFPIYGIINSGYLSNSFVYVGLGSLYYFSYYSIKNKRVVYKVK